MSQRRTKAGIPYSPTFKHVHFTSFLIDPNRKKGIFIINKRRKMIIWKEHLALLQYSWLVNRDSFLKHLESSRGHSSCTRQKGIPLFLKHC